LRLQYLGMPTLEPAARIVAGAKKAIAAPRSAPVRTATDRRWRGSRRDLRRARRLADIAATERDRAHQIGAIGRQHARHPVAEGVTDDESRPLASCAMTAAHVARIVVQINSCERAPTLSDAARLRPQHAVTRARQPFRDRLEVRRAAAERRKQNDDAALAVALRQDFDADAAVRDNAAARRWRRCSHMSPPPLPVR
jgi:hypothetical protein